MNLNKSEQGWKPRYNITWHITPDIMTYFTHSEGFRPGGFNRTKTNLDGSVHHPQGRGAVHLGQQPVPQARGL